MLYSYLEGQFVEYEGHQFPINPDMMSLLHHWYFGLTKDYYRSKDKNIILPDRKGKLVKVEDIGKLLDAMMIRYNEVMEAAYLDEQKTMNL